MQVGKDVMGCIACLGDNIDEYLRSIFFYQLQMVVNWWHPVLFANTGVPVPPDGALIQRQPIIITYNPWYSKPSFMSDFKPSYIWAES